NPDLLRRSLREAPVGAIVDRAVAAREQWQRETVMDHLKYLPGRFMRVALSSIDFVNTITLGRYLSQLMETLPREGQYVALRKRGASQTRARAGAMRVT